MSPAATPHSSVPRGVAANLAFRGYVLLRCKYDRKFRKFVVKLCRDDILFFINTFVWQFNPNAIGQGSTENGPFVTWGVQEEAVEEILYCIRHRKDLAIEKSREMGASWLCLIVMTWFILFHRYKKFLCVSKDESSVDSPDFDSLFWKIDYILEHLPKWLKPSIRRVKLRITNKEFKSAITGVASTADAGVGGRATAIFGDEFSLHKHDFAFLKHTANTTGCRIFNGTHRGSGTALAAITDAENPLSSVIRKFRMHWSRHPDKAEGAYHYDNVTQKVVPHDPLYEYPPDFKFDTSGKPTGGPFPGLRSPWYDDMCLRMGSDRAIAMDLDIDVLGSVETLFPPVFIKTLIDKYAREPDWQGDLELNGDGTLLFNERRGGPLKLWQRTDKEMRPEPAPYVFGVDPSHGTGATPSCVSGMNARTGEKVFQYASAGIEPTPLGYLMVAVCRHWKDQDHTGANLIWEIQGPGATFGKRIIESGYRRLYYRTDEHRISNKPISDSPGWSSEAKSKYNLIMGYKDGLKGSEKGRCLNHSRESLLDCLKFSFVPSGMIEHSGEASKENYSGARINHGDMVIADALAWKYTLELKRLATLAPDGQPEEIKVGSLAWRKLLRDNTPVGSSPGRPWAN